MGFKWPFLLKFTVHVWTHRFPRWLWKSQPGNPSCQKQYLRQEALPLERPVQELNHTNQPILFYFSNEKKKLGKEKRNRCYLSNKSISACVHALIFSTGGIQSLSSFPIAFWDLHYALSSASSPGICLSSLLLFPLSLHFAAEGSCWVLGGGDGLLSLLPFFSGTFMGRLASLYTGSPCPKSLPSCPFHWWDSKWDESAWPCLFPHASVKLLA